MFQPKMITAQVKLALIVGTTFILLPLLIPDSHGADSPAISKSRKGRTLPRPHAAPGSDTAPVPSPTPSDPAVQHEDSSRELWEKGLIEWA